MFDGAVATETLEGLKVRQHVDSVFQRLYERWVHPDQASAAKQAVREEERHTFREIPDEDGDNASPRPARKGMAELAMMYGTGNCIGICGNGRPCTFKSSRGPYCKHHAWQATQAELKDVKPKPTKMKLGKALEIEDEEDDDFAEESRGEMLAKRRRKYTRTLRDDKDDINQLSSSQNVTLDSSFQDDEADTKSFIMKRPIKPHRPEIERPQLKDIFDPATFKPPVWIASRKLHLPFLSRALPQGEPRYTSKQASSTLSRMPMPALDILIEIGAARRKARTPRRYESSLHGQAAPRSKYFEKSPEPILSSSRRTSGMQPVAAYSNSKMQPDVKVKKPRKPYTFKNPDQKRRKKTAMVLEVSDESKDEAEADARAIAVKTPPVTGTASTPTTPVLRSSAKKVHK